MTYKPKDTSKSVEKYNFDNDKLIRFYRNGVSLTQPQKNQLADAGIELSSIKSVKKMVEEYMLSHQSVSTVMLEATREGWVSDLRNYIYAVAEVQAQLICGEAQVGWDGFAIFGPGVAITDALLHDFLRKQREQASIGYIAVGIPTPRITQWKRNAEWRAQQEAKQDHSQMQKPKTNLTPAFDNYLSEQMGERLA